ncbi:MAG: hypothetical protein QMC81_11215 [Thermoanaerobacterales bacterium]|nr:hypothetical protein [Bacillota bacterium]MDI6908038.1 hypothetical protein [Thermoanaerobacterales bacterium]
MHKINYGHEDQIEVTLKNGFIINFDAVGNELFTFVYNPQTDEKTSVSFGMDSALALAKRLLSCAMGGALIGGYIHQASGGYSIELRSTDAGVLFSIFDERKEQAVTIPLDNEAVLIFAELLVRYVRQSKKVAGE